MKVLIDGKEVECNNDVKVIFDDGGYYDEADGNEVEVEPHLSITHEGLILDNIVTKEESQIFSTMAFELDCMIEQCK